MKGGRRGAGLGIVLALAALALLLAGSACSRRRPAPTQPAPEDLPPEVAAVWPPPRSAVVVVDLPYEIWAQFNIALDSATVDTLHVFFMIDTRRLPAYVRWDREAKRIWIRPKDPLLVLQAYTVELSAQLRSAAGVPLGRSYTWQFRTSSLRNPLPSYPGDGAVNVSPYASVLWFTHPGDPPVSYFEVYAGRDSAAVRARTAPLLYRGPAQYYVPPTRWPQDGAPVYWALNAYNTEWGDRAVGPVWTFTTTAATTRVDSLKLYLGSSGYSYDEAWGRCDDFEIQAGPGTNAALVWNFESLALAFRRNLRLTGARMVVAAATGYEATLDSSSLTLWSAKEGWACDAIRLDGPPYADEARGPLASSVHAGPGWVRFMSDTLTAHVEAAARWGIEYGYVLRADLLDHLLPPGTTQTARRPYLVFYFYR